MYISGEKPELKMLKIQVFEKIISEMTSVFRMLCFDHFAGTVFGIQYLEFFVN